ncbi:glycosyltransferase [Flavobacterium taihuense]|uniref:Glycosyltransferase n=1 Tax=Flavobacterium taihuense TaxID=2857508 RepID=A0ABS6XVP9_9FLAO|nr:glycosyltransferase [Flavobacterium taihuense]MBW4360346.1 glycosyltransferase [Flavobacterium taihuense]
MKNVLIVYHYIAHYRIPIFNLLSKSNNPKYTILSGVKTDINIKTADEHLSQILPETGGINWLKTENYWFLKYFLFQPSVLKLSLSTKYDTIIYLGNMYYLSTWIGAILARLTNKKVIFWTHGFIREEKNFQGFVRSVFYRLADEILVYGQRAKDILIAKGFSEQMISVVYNSLDYDEQLKIRNEVYSEKKLEIFKHDELPVFGFIGRLTKQKRIDLLVDVLYKINEGNRKANLLLIGDGEQMDFLKKKVKELNLDDFVVFYGACYDEKIICQLMQLMNVVVSPGEVGLNAIHSLCYGVPVVTHNRYDKQMPEYQAIVENKTGTFFEYEEPIESLLIVLKDWLFNKNKKQTREDCFKMIDEYYNPYAQNKIFDSIV